MALYVAFDDSTHDPTYAFLDAAFLVEGPDDHSGNPCAPRAKGQSAPLCPTNLSEAAAFARLMGWELVVANGQVTFRTGISAAHVVQSHGDLW